MAIINEHPNVVAFLDMLAWSEGTKGKGDDGYNIIVGGSQFNDYREHPRKLIDLPRLGIKSTAAGRYQLLSKYYDAYKRLLKLSDFSPVNQDKIAIQQIKERKAYQLIISGQLPAAILQCSNIWASLPGNNYGQRQHQVADLTAKFVEFGGVVA